MSNLIHKWLFTFTTYFKQILHCNVEGLAIFQITENGGALHVNTSGTYKSTGCIPTEAVTVFFMTSRFIDEQKARLIGD